MFAVLFFTICLAGGTTVDWRSEIDDGNDRFISAFSSGDYQEIKGLFASSSHFSFNPKDYTAYNNRDIAEWFMDEHEAGVSSIELDTGFVTNLGEVANERGMYTMRKEDGSVAYSGMYLTSWFLKDGQLKITMAMWTY